MKTRESGMPPEPTWESFFTPAVVLEKLGLSRSVGNVLDFGCGYGTFAIPAAQVVSGKVIALDIDAEMVQATRAKANAAGLSNVVVYLRDFVTNGSGLPDESVDYVMLFNILHAEERDVLLHEARRVMTTTGTLAVMHWNYDAATPRGPSMGIRPQPAACQTWVEQLGFMSLPSGLIDLPPYHYGFTFKKAT